MPIKEQELVTVSDQICFFRDFRAVFEYFVIQKDKLWI